MRRPNLLEVSSVLSPPIAAMIMRGIVLSKATPTMRMPGRKMSSMKSEMAGHSGGWSRPVSVVSMTSK